MKANNLKIKTKNKTYSIIIGNNLLKNFLNILKKNSLNFDKCLIVVDSKVPRKFLNQIRLSIKNKKKIIYLFKSKEMNKNIKSFYKILEILLKNNFHRNDCLISLGGGVTGDVSGFAASVFKRGINFINIPTTLLAQVDSSIGGKTGVNTNFGKNLLGSFYQPSLVISDTNFLKTLPKREIVSGYAEILKHSLILNKKFFLFLDKFAKKILHCDNLVLQKAIYQSCLIKKKVVENDENEKNSRKILNFGHTFAHAFEAKMNFSKKLNHGEAVLLGINSAVNFSFKKKIINKRDYNLIKNHLKKYLLPNKISKYFVRNDINQILNYMQKDKKNKNNKINLVLLKKIGKPNYHYYTNKKILKKFLNNELIY